MARPRKASVELNSLDDANRAMRELLEQQIELEKQQGSLDYERAAVTAKYERPIDHLKGRINDLTIQLQTWYMANVKELEKGGKKSMQLNYGMLGRRLGQPTLKPLNRAWTWTAIAVKLRTVFGQEYFHEPVELKIDKDRAKSKLSGAELRDCGLKIAQEETFYAEPDRAKLGDLAKEPSHV